MSLNCPAIGQGYSKTCRDVQGGILKFWVTEHANLESYTEASGVITAITLTAGKKFWLIEQELNTASATATPQSNRQNGTTFVEDIVNMVLHKQTASINYWLRSMAHQDLLIVAQHQTGTNFVYGVRNGMSLEPSESPTGVASGDLNGYNLVFRGEEPYMPMSISQAIIDAND